MKTTDPIVGAPNQINANSKEWSFSKILVLNILIFISFYITGFVWDKVAGDSCPHVLLSFIFLGSLGQIITLIYLSMRSKGDRGYSALSILVLILAFLLYTETALNSLGCSGSIFGG